MKILYTDYPFIELGDTPNEKAPVRKVLPISYDQDKYVKVLVDGTYCEVKRGYIYTERGRLGEVPSITHDQLNNWMRNSGNGTLI